MENRGREYGRCPEGKNGNDRIEETGKRKGAVPAVRQRGNSRRKRWDGFSISNIKKYRAVWIAVGVLATGILIVLCAYAGFLPAPLQAQVDILPDKRAKAGTLHETEGRTLAEGDFWVVLNQIPAVEDKTQECNIEYENPESNHYSARVNLYLKSTGELLGGTRRVDPGNYVETVKLEKELPPGEYPVTAKIELFQKKEPAGGLSLDITLRVAEQEGGGTE